MIEKSQSSNSKLQAVFKICRDLGEGAQSAPGLDKVKPKREKEKGNALICPTSAHSPNPVCAIGVRPADGGFAHVYICMGGRSYVYGWA